MTLQYSTTEVINVGTNLAVNYEIPFSFAWLDENDIKVYRTDTNTPVPDAQWQFKTRQSIGKYQEKLKRKITCYPN